MRGGQGRCTRIFGWSRGKRRGQTSCQMGKAWEERQRQPTCQMGKVWEEEPEAGHLPIGEGGGGGARGNPPTKWGRCGRVVGGRTTATWGRCGRGVMMKQPSKKGNGWEVLQIEPTFLTAKIPLEYPNKATLQTK